MAKIGRNQPCPCGSGIKFKRCHGRLIGGIPNKELQAAIEGKFRELDAQRVQREAQQGLGKPIISTFFGGRRLVVVGNRIYYSPNWRTFHDFLREFLLGTLGEEWLNGERAKPEAQRNTIVRWYDQALREIRDIVPNENGMITGPMSGAQRAFLNLAYNLYLIAHHSEPSKSDEVLNSFLVRLKSARQDDFVGKLFETYMSAAFLKAGFSLDYENERDGSKSHVEFVATYPPSERRFAVEVKTRNLTPTEDGPVDDARRLRVAQKLVKALRKDTPHERIVCIEVNVPDVVHPDTVDGSWMQSAQDQIRHAEEFLDSNGDHYPPAYVIVTNHAFHNNLDAQNAGIQAITDGFRIATYGATATASRLEEYLAQLREHHEVFTLFKSLETHSRIPVTFDGENPEFAFGEDEEFPRLQIGRQYLVPDEGGVEVIGELEQATVLDGQRKAFCVYKVANNRRIMVTNDLTDREMAAWRQHPDTFFGRVEAIRTPPENWLELAHFFYETYRHSTKAKLLEFLAGQADIDRLQNLSRDELAIIYSERVGWEAWRRRDPGAE